MVITMFFGLMPFAYAADHPNPVTTIYIFCKIRSYVAQSSTMMFRWLMTMASIDRFMLSSANPRLRRFANSRIACRIVLLIVIIWIILPVHGLIVLQIEQGACTIPFLPMSIYNTFFTLILGGSLPSLIMITCVVLIRYNLSSKRERRQHTTSQHTGNSTNHLLNARDHQAVVMLFVQIGFYILTTMPWLIFLLYNAFTLTVINKSPDRLAIESLLRYLTEIIIYMYPTWSFYIHTLSAHTFRDQLIKILYSIFTCRNRCYNRPRCITPSVGNT